MHFNLFVQDDSENSKGKKFQISADLQELETASRGLTRWALNYKGTVERRAKLQLYKTEINEISIAAAAAGLIDLRAIFGEEVSIVARRAVKLLRAYETEYPLAR